MAKHVYDQRFSPCSISFLRHSALPFYHMCIVLCSSSTVQSCVCQRFYEENKRINDIKIPINFPQKSLVNKYIHYNSSLIKSSQKCTAQQDTDQHGTTDLPTYTHNHRRVYCRSDRGLHVVRRGWSKHREYRTHSDTQKHSCQSQRSGISKIF